MHCFGAQFRGGCKATVLILVAVLVCMAWPLRNGPRDSVRAEDSIRIGSIFALSGPAAKSNEPSVLGVRWAVSEINSSGGVLGKQLELLEIDNASTPIGSKVAADKAVKANVAAIIGPAWSSHALAVARVAQAQGIPMITNIATHPAVTRIGDYIFRVCYNDQLQGQVMAEFARHEIKARRVVILQDITSDYSLGLASTFQDLIEKHDAASAVKLSYKARQPDFADMLRQAQAARPDIIFLPGHDESGVIISQAVGLGLDVTFLGGDGWDVQSFFQRGGHLLVNGYYTTHWHEAIQSGRSKAFFAKYKGRNPFLAPAALSLDAVYLLADAMGRAGTVQGDRVRDALLNTRGFEGVTGKLTFDLHGDPLKSVVIMKITNGRPSYYRQIDGGLSGRKADAS